MRIRAACRASLWAVIAAALLLGAPVLAQDGSSDMPNAQDFAFDPTKDGEDQARATLEVALGANEDEARAAAEALVNAAASPCCWDALKELTERSTAPAEQISRWRNELILNIAKAKPEEAEAYLGETVERCQKEIHAPAKPAAEPAEQTPMGRGGKRMPPAMWHRESALSQMAALPGETSSRIAFWGKMVRTYPDDVAMARAIVIPMHQNRTREGWDFAHADLPAVLEAGLRHSDRTTREFTYRVYLRGLEAGGPEAAARLAPSLHDALEREEDATLVAQVREKLK